MSGSASGADLPGAQRAASGLRRRAAAALTLGGGAALAVLGLGALLLPPTAWRPPSSIPMATLTLALGLLVALGWAAGAVWRGLAVERLAREAERSVGLREGELRGALELWSPARQGVEPGAGSPALARLQRRRVEAALSGCGPKGLFPTTARVWRRRWRLALAASIGSGGLLAVVAVGQPERASAAGTALVRPWRVAFPPPLPPLEVEPRGAEVPRGQSLRVRVRARGRDRVWLRWRVEGELPGGSVLSVPVTEVAVGATDPVRAPARYWAEDASGSSSDTFLVRPRDPLLLTSLAVRVTLPGWLGRVDETHERPVPPLRIPEGSRLHVEGSANRPLRSANLLGLEGEGTVSLEVEGTAFRGDLRPRVDGSWSVELVGGGERAALTDTLRVAVTQDSLPRVEIVFPGADTVLGLDLSLPLVLDARDDYGVRSVELVRWRRSGSGTDNAPRVDEVAAEEEDDPRLVLRPLLEGEGLGLLPGDTLVYFARVRDGNPVHPPVSSDTFRARVPGLGELRERAVERADRLTDEARALGERAGRLEHEAREAERRGATPSPDRPSGESAGAGAEEERASFAATEEGRRILAEAEELESRVSRISEEMATLQAELERAGLLDPAVREQMARLEELYRELLETGLRERIEELQRALRELDGDALREALERLSAEMRQIQERLEQSVALMERVAAEQALKELEARTEQLAEAQRGAAESAARDETWGRTEARLAEEVRRLAEALERLEERLAAATAPEAADSVSSAAGRSESAARAMEAAAEAAGARSPPGRRSEAGGGAGGRTPPPEGEARSDDAQAGEAARSAAADLESAAQALDAARAELESGWRAEAIEAVDRATTEAIDLAREQAELLAEMRRQAAGAGRPSSATRARQGALRQGLDNLVQRLAEAGRRTALLDRRVGPAAARAVSGMEELLASMDPEPARGASPPAGGEAALEALNELAGRLLASRRALEASRSATGMEEALEQLARMAEAQGGLARQAGGLLLLQESGRAIAQGLERLAREQAEIARRLRELGSRPETEGLAARPEELAAEAEGIARDVRSRGLDPETLRRQERLFRRLLDAGRTLERPQREPRRRESRAPDPTLAPHAPTAEGAALGGPRWPHPRPEDLRGLPAAYRGIVLDYFDRLNRTVAGEPGAAGSGEGREPDEGP